MKKHSPFTQSFDLLPNTLPVFPLSNAVVLPGGLLPLNIFEPRYLNMFKDAMKGAQLVGMIQPKDDQTPPDLFDIGCAARIIRYEETSDGRLEILLAGLCRFERAEELSSMRGYRLIVPSWKQFEGDYHDQVAADAQAGLLFTASLRRFFKIKNIEVDWETIEQLSQETLINNLIGQLPISVEDRQLLLEADTLADRVKSFTAVLDGCADQSTAKH